MNRRQLLGLFGAAGAAALLPSGSRRKVARAAAPASPKKLVLVFASGGWDTTIALDPKVQSAKVDVAEGVTRNFGNINIHTNAAGWPAVTDFFTRYGAITSVVRGISVSSIAHRECQIRMSTGTREASNGDMGAIVATQHGAAMPLPYLVLGDIAYTGPYAVNAGRVGQSNQIVTLLDPDEAYATGPRFTPNANEEQLVAAYANASALRQRATRGAAGYNAKVLSDYQTSIEKAKLLRTVRDGFGERGRTLTLDSQVDLAVTALQQGVSQTVMLNTRLGWDTHDRNDVDQARLHQTAFTGVARLADQLAAANLLDDTVVCVYSEFSRTPRRNADAGKDHWPVTSAVVFGGGIKGNQVVGATTAAVEPRKIDLDTGAPSASGVTLTSSMFVGGVLSACGVDPSSFIESPEVLNALVA